jgi:D-alanine-D-alanine ligase
MRYLEGSRVHKKPPSTGRKAAPWRIALIANIKDEIDWGPDAPPDAGSEFDRRDTLEAIAAALEEDGHWVHICRGDDTLPEVLQNLRPHICFNIAEGLGGDAREAQVPALCELLGIPYTASQVLANALSLDKTRTKRIWRDHNLPTAPFQEWRSPNENLDPALTFPLFVKPVREGTGMGVDTSAVVHDEKSLRERVEWLVRAYRQPALVESYLPGREFTVGFIGNPGDTEFRSRPWLYNERGYHFFPVLEIDNTISISPGVYGHDAKGFDIGVEGAPGYLCPADIPNRLRLRLLDLARRASEALGARDVSRIDFRTTAEGKPYLMEINTLPGLNPQVSDLCIMAASEGMAYPVLITEILYLAAERYGLPFEPRLREHIISASELGSMATNGASWGYASRGQGS